MGGGKGGGGGEIPAEIQQTAQILRDIGQEQFDLGLPLAQIGGNQAMQMLQSGNVDALMPGIRVAVEQERSNQSAGLRNLEEQIARSGLTGTAAQEMLARGRVGAESQVANVPSQFTLPFLNQVAGPAFNLTEQGLGSIGQAGQIGGMAAGPARAGGGAAGALGGAASGAMAGSMIMPGIGTGVGAVLGGLMGSK